MEGHVLDGMASDVAESSEGVTWDVSAVNS